MITIDFGGKKRRSTPNITTKWLQDAYHDRIVDANVICVNIHIRHGQVNLPLLCGNCQQKGTKRDEDFNRGARYVIKLWRQHNLDQDSFAFGNLESFLRKVFKHFGMKLK